ncbi:flagellar biosynthetic protein FliR [Paludibacterium paludis]|uniref:Flagellar biosynthetic protein FliR n=1 Tax=Paludibacterium paludis TaxID=1225769 RepID=A0A918UBC8_9NEIS|nr:flagellar biosynthetic protein FliR [Paludibacterium paludis]GGY28763.1 flagellar biosynthetic protein FliR [Paludibacterium paludis]
MMTFTLDLSWVYATLLLSLRLAPSFFLTPLLGPSPIPAPVKVVLTLGLSSFMVLAQAVPVRIPDSVWELIGQMASEALLGAALAYSVQAAFAALSFAGRTVDTQIGFSLAGLVNPMTRVSEALSGLLFELLAVAYLYAVNGHHMLLRALAFSVRSAPLGLPFAVPRPEMIIGQFATVFTLALALAAPLLVTLFVLDAGVAVMSRSLPQFNAFVIAMPVKVLVGLAVFAILIPRLGDFFERWLTSILDGWAKLVPLG